MVPVVSSLRGGRVILVVVIVFALLFGIMGAEWEMGRARTYAQRAVSRAPVPPVANEVPKAPPGPRYVETNAGGGA